MDCIACRAPLSMGFSRQEYWSGLPFPPPKGCVASLLGNRTLVSRMTGGDTHHCTNEEGEILRFACKMQCFTLLLPRYQNSRFLHENHIILAELNDIRALTWGPHSLF